MLMRARMGLTRQSSTAAVRDAAARQKLSIYFSTFRGQLLTFDTLLAHKEQFYELGTWDSQC